MPPLPISIIVPTLDEAAHIRVALEALGSLRDCGHEVIVVDGGSVDETFAIAQPHADHALAAPRGRAIQMNVGASVARGRVLLFLHADCRLPQPALRAIGEAHAAGHRWGRFDVELVGRSRLLRLVATTMNERSALTGIATGDQAIFVDRALFDRVGGFPPIPLMEDIAISKRLRATAGKPARLRQPVRASGRRWDAHGASRTIASMAGLRFAYWRGVDPELLARRYYGRSAHRRATLVIFAKAPVPGRVKTRLATAIGATEATAVYRELVQKTLDDAVAARRAGVVASVELWAAPESGPDVLAQWASSRDMALRLQHGRDLGERMRIALESTLQKGQPALLIGTDAPGIDVAYLARAAHDLQSRDAVFGPAEDGGYVLVGLSRSVNAFDGIAWSTPNVMCQTRERLATANVRWSELPPLFDIDTVEDLMRWRRDASTLAVASS